MLRLWEYSSRIALCFSEECLRVVPQLQTRPYEGKEVFVIGEWSAFKIKEPLYKGRCELSLSVGQHQYKFIVDGEWKYDPKRSCVSDNHGGFNNVIQVLPKRAWQILEGKQPCLIRVMQKADFVLGSWDQFKEQPLQTRRNHYRECEEYYTYLDLEAGEYEFIFKDGDRYFHDECQPSIQKDQHKNNIMAVQFNSIGEKEEDIKTVTWHKFNLLNRHFDHLHGHTMTSIGNSFYIFGGSMNMCHTNNLYKLTFQNHELEAIDNAEGFTPSKRSFHNAIAYGSKILFFGGLNEQQVLNDHFVYNIPENTWYQAKTDGKLTARERASMTFYQQEECLIYFGGYFCSSDMEHEIIYNDVYYMNIQTMSFLKMELTNPPAPRYGHSATQINENMFVFAGTNQQEHFNDMHVLNLSSRQWRVVETKGKPPAGRHGHSANLFKQKICIFGGKGDFVRFNDVHIFDYITETWTECLMFGDIPQPRYFHAAEVHQGQELWILGGNIGLKKNEHFYIMTFNQ